MAAKLAAMPAMSDWLSWIGFTAPAVNGTGLGATGTQPPASGAIGAPPSQGTAQLALRPAWAIWMPGTAPEAAITLARRLSTAACSGL